MDRGSVEHLEAEGWLEDGLDDAPFAEAEVMVEADVVKFWRGNVLMEYELDGHVQRCWLPEEEAGEAGVGGHVRVPLGVLESGAPYGDDLSSVMRLRCPSPEECQDFLRRRGVWTLEELMNEKLPRLLQAMYQVDAAIVQGRVRELLMKRR